MGMMYYADVMALPFLPFSNQKQQLQRYLDGVSDAIYIPNGFPFGFQAHTVAYVSCLIILCKSVFDCLMYLCTCMHMYIGWH